MSSVTLPKVVENAINATPSPRVPVTLQALPVPVCLHVCSGNPLQKRVYPRAFRCRAAVVHG